MIVYHGTTEMIEKPDVQHSKKYLDLTDQHQLSEIYKQNLETDIIKALSNMKQIELRKAFDIYYSSKLAAQIADGSYGIENLDAKYLAEDLIENESELFL